MGIKRGVSLYSYQQSDWFGKMRWRDQLKEVATNLGGATGIEIISEATIPHYPMPPESFIFDWNNEIARWGLKSVTMDCYLDVLQFRTHVMNSAETAERLKYDLNLAAKLGFQNIRLVHNVPHDAILMALPTAEKLGVRMTNEIHAPAHIKPHREMTHPATMQGLDWGTRVAEDVAFIEKYQTPFYGLQPDMGIFQDKPSKAQLGYTLRAFVDPETSFRLVDEYYDIFNEEGQDAAVEHIAKAIPEIVNTRHFSRIQTKMSCQPEDLFDIAKYIYCIHGKFYGMTEIKGEPGHYEEASIKYKEVFEVLNAIGYDGYIDSEYEGQRSQQDLGDEYLPSEIDEVRHHHEMMKRLIGA